jgi:Zn-dependent membrane protease YugP
VILIIGLVLMLALAFGPSIWIRRVMAQHADDRPDFPGTGAELARHLLDQASLQAVVVEEGSGDHYDPDAKAVRLSKGNFEGRSLTAVAVAAHEVGHAVQDRDGYAPLIARQKIVAVASRADQIATAASFGLSIIGGAAISPRVLMIGFAVIMLSGLIRVIANLVTLPVEFDASYNRALPVLATGYIPPDDQDAARQILRAAALTYVASALVSVLNVMRFLRWLR